MITGIDFKNYCQWNLCNRYPVNFNPDLIQDGDFVFLNLDTINQFIDKMVSINFTKKINLITHNSDSSFTKEMLDKIRHFVIKVYPINSIVSDDIVCKIPLGFSDRLSPVISSMNKEYTKDNLLYMNFNIHSGRIPERTECYNYFSKFDWVKAESNIPETQYYTSLKNSKYSACPIGAGLDTHRFYESIYFKTIPIIKRNQLSDIHEKFPCVIVDNWDQIDYEFLIINYDRLFDKLNNWINLNDWSSVNYWINKISDIK